MPVKQWLTDCWSLCQMKNCMALMQSSYKPRYCAQMAATWGPDDMVAFIACSQSVPVCKTVHMTWQHRSDNSAFFNWQAVRPHCKLHRCPKSSQRHGEVIVRLNVNIASPTKRDKGKARGRDIATNNDRDREGGIQRSSPQRQHA